MKYNPFEIVTYETKLSESEIMRRLADFLQPRAFSGWRRIYNAELSKPYEGVIENKKFKIQRITDTPRANPPVIIGYIKNNPDTTTIKVIIRPPISQLLLAFSFFIICLTASLFSPVESLDGFVVSLHFVFIFYITWMINIPPESARTKTDLQKLFEAEEI